MRIAIPLTSGKLAEHFGHCEQFMLADADPKTRQVLQQQLLAAPDHVPGLLPKWLLEGGVNVVIAGAVGTRARDLLAAGGVRLLSGVPSVPPDALINGFLEGTLETGDSRCDHSGHSCSH